jgi:hypothetical protein
VLPAILRWRDSGSADDIAMRDKRLQSCMGGAVLFHAKTALQTVRFLIIVRTVVLPRRLFLWQNPT